VLQAPAAPSPSLSTGAPPFVPWRPLLVYSRAPHVQAAITFATCAHVRFDPLKLGAPESGLPGLPHGPVMDPLLASWLGQETGHGWHGIILLTWHHRPRCTGSASFRSQRALPGLHLSGSAPRESCIWQRKILQMRSEFRQINADDSGVESDGSTSTAVCTHGVVASAAGGGGADGSVAGRGFGASEAWARLGAFEAWTTRGVVLLCTAVSRAVELSLLVRGRLLDLRKGTVGL